MIQAVLQGKSKGYEYSEDILTSTVLGNLKYLRNDAALIPFIESAFLYNTKRTTLWDKLNSEGIDLRCYSKVQYEFWAWNQNYGEPDLILIFKDHVHNLDDLLILIEVKFKSGKSGTGENDQLARYFHAISHDLENFTESSVSNFQGMKGYIIYLTEAGACNDITASNEIIQARNNEIKENVFHLRWHKLYKVFESMYSYYSSFEKTIVDDLMQYLEKLGLRDFSGITPPNSQLEKVFSQTYPIFFHSGYEAVTKTTYFDKLKPMDFNNHNYIFYKGE